MNHAINHTEYKDSPVGRIPKSWEVAKVSEVVISINSGWSPKCEEIPSRPDEWGVLKTTAVDWNGFDPQYNKRIPTTAQGRPDIAVKAGDILLTRAGPIDRVGVVSYVSKSPSKLMLSDKIIRLNTEINRCDPHFLSLHLSNDSVQTYLFRVVSGMAESQVNISQEIIKNAPMIIPSLPEQKKITNILTSIDSKIEVKRQKLQQTQNLKKSLMQDLLTGKVKVSVN